MSLKLHPCVFFALAMGIIAVADKCPANEDITPCTCENLKNDAYVTCFDLQNFEELRLPLSSLKGHKIYSLEIKQSNLGDLPGYIFKDTHIEGIKFSYTRMTSIGDDQNPPFSGLENILQRLTIIEGFWNYDEPLTKPIRLNHLKKLTYLNLQNNVIPKLGNDWFKDGPRTLKDLYIETALVKEMGDEVFKTLENLRALHFSGNAVTPGRRALPAKALHLHSLDLSENEIQKLPDDIFSDFPSLKYVYLDSNGLQSIPESTWKSTLPQLDFLFIHSNPLVCDSKIKWIINQNLHGKIIGECALPPALSGRQIETLTTKEVSG